MNLSNSGSGEGIFDNKYLIGIVMVIINFGARFIVNELNEEQNEYDGENDYVMNGNNDDQNFDDLDNDEYGHIYDD